MLTLTDGAKEAVRRMVEAELPQGGGLRIRAEPVDEDESELALDVVPAPEQGDQVVESDGARVFLEPTAASLLDDQVLDAEWHDDHAHFAIEPQESDD
jgi:iron-sulfur cluster assembly protein